MAETKIPCGGWYIDDSTLKFNKDKVLSVIGGDGAGSSHGKYSKGLHLLFSGAG